MIKIFVFTLMLLIELSPAIAADRFITKLQLPSGQTVVIAEGEFEARSIGSFSIRLYQPAPPGDETTFFSSGLVSTRDGTVENVVLADINNDHKPEIIVIVRSAGTGGYRSAHAFMISNGQTLVNSARIANLQPEADPVLALKALRAP